MRSHFTFLFALLIAIGIVFACSDSKKTETTTKKEPTQFELDKEKSKQQEKEQQKIQKQEQENKEKQEQEKKEAREKIVLTVDGMKLCSDYKSNEVSADSKYKDRKLKVTGIVSAIRKVGGDIIVDLETGTGEINCWINESDGKKAGSLKGGDDITIIGKCTGTGALTSDIQIKGCSITQIRKF